jgi:hypothetical protein
MSPVQSFEKEAKGGCWRVSRGSVTVLDHSSLAVTTTYLLRLGGRRIGGGDGGNGARLAEQLLRRWIWRARLNSSTRCARNSLP